MSLGTDYIFMVLMTSLMAKRFCENDYVAWSTPVDNLADWRYEGVIYKKDAGY